MTPIMRLLPNQLVRFQVEGEAVKAVVTSLVGVHGAEPIGEIQTELSPDKLDERSCWSFLEWFVAE